MLSSRGALSEGQTPVPAFDKLYSRANLLKVLEPYTVSTGSLQSPEWRQAARKADRAWRWKYWRRRLGLDRSEKAVSHVKSSYEGNWQQSVLPIPEGDAVAPCRWNDEAYFLRAYGEKRAHAFILNRIMHAVRPSSVLEVGSGDGVFASVVAGGYPAASFTALELTDSGIAKAKALQSQQPLAPELRDFAPYSFEEEAVRKINFVQGNSRKLPANDRSFDLVYTSLALEQMAAVKDEALREIARVSSRYVVLIEPFRDFNQDRTRRYFTGARDYFPLYVRELLRYGLRPIYVSSDFPAKITRGVGLVVAEVVAGIASPALVSKINEQGREMGIGSFAYKLHQAYVDHVVTGPNPLYRPAFGRGLNKDEVSKKVDNLRHDGVTDIENYADRDLAGRLSAQMDAAAAGTHPSTGTIYSDIVNYHIVEKPLRLGNEILQLATHPSVLAVIERYFRHRVYLADVDARIIPPTRIEEVEANLAQRGKKKTASSSHWHRDARGRQVKLMAYLSDVGDDDTRFAFVPFTHKNASLHPTIDETRFTDEEVAEKYPAPVEWLAPAGSAKLFDTNLVHRLLRKPTGTVRYSVTFYYTPGQHLRELAVNRSDFDSLSREQREVLKGGEADRIKLS